MPHTLRLATLLERDYRQHAPPLQQLKRQLPQIDELCKTLGVSPFSHFIDISAIEWQEAAQLTNQEPANQEPSCQEPTSLEADPETGTPLTIEDFSWHPAALGMASLEAVSLHLQHGENLRFQASEVSLLLAELAFCLEHLAPLEANGGQFHFAAA